MAPPPTRPVARRRQAFALLLAVAATAAVWALFLRGGAGGQDGSGGGGDAGISPPVEKLVAEMSPGEQVDQVLLLGFDGTDATSPMVAELQGRQVGGVLIRSANWIEAGQGAALIAQLRAAGLAGGRIPPMIAVRQEGGPYRTLPDLPPEARELDVGDRGSAGLAESWSRQAGLGLRSVGVDLNLFPIADVATLDSPVAARAFSDDAQVAAEMTAAAVRGCRDARIACAVAHFPGLGAASQDTDQGPATVSLDAGSLADRDLAAFRAAFSERVPAVVLSLAFYAAYDPVTPGALSESVVTGLLRDDYGYEGAAITDDLGAGAVKADYSVPEAAVAAIQAGADMVQIDSPADQNGVRDALLKAVASGEIPEARLAQAAGRILQLKRQMGLIPSLQP
jgi:beta-N-acetylhexosaminidase